MKKTIGLMLFVLVTVSLHAQSTNGNSKGSSTPVEKAFFFTEKKALKFGNIVMGTSKTLELNFTNTGKKTLVIKSVYTNCIENKLNMYLDIIELITRSEECSPFEMLNYTYNIIRYFPFF